MQHIIGNMVNQTADQKLQQLLGGYTHDIKMQEQIAQFLNNISNKIKKKEKEIKSEGTNKKK